MFYRWLSATRSARHRRVTLQRKEDQMNAACVAIAWDKWRERFVDEKLRPIVSPPSRL
jgi:protein SFI1